MYEAESIWFGPNVHNQTVQRLTYISYILHSTSLSLIPTINQFRKHPWANHPSSRRQFPDPSLQSYSRVCHITPLCILLRRETHADISCFCDRLGFLKCAREVPSSFPFSLTSIVYPANVNADRWEASWGITKIFHQLRLSYKIFEARIFWRGWKRERKV